MGISAWGRARDDHGNRRHPHPGAARAHRRTARSRSGARRRGARRRDPRDGRARRGLPAPVPGAHARGHRPGRRGARDRAGTARAVRRAHPPRPCRVRRARACAARPGHRGGRGHPLRSRGFVAATRPRRARVLLLAGCPARHAHGCHEHAHRGDHPRDLPRGGTAADLLRVRRREARPALREPDRAAAGTATAGDLGSARRAHRRRDARRRPARRSPGQARVPGAAHRGRTRSSQRSSARSRRRSTRSRSAAASSCLPTSPSRIASSSAPCRFDPLPRRPRACPWNCRSTARSCVCSCAVPNSSARRNALGIRAPRPCALRAAERMRAA